MSLYFERNLAKISNCRSRSLFTESKIGLERESLRVGQDGKISQTSHPRALGSALTNASFTTDYSEALLEIVTPPFTNKDQLRHYLNSCQTFVYSALENEILWASSMPCVVAGESSIPIARYGNSNLGMMKSVYRNGLGLRYGRLMQVIAGIHFNYSYSETFWESYLDGKLNSNNLRDVVSESYFAQIRNIQRIGWLIPYLFGNSPAVCKSFLQGVVSDLVPFDDTTFYQPYATSLRLGDIGYQNSREDETGIKVNYDTLNQYVKSLHYAISTPHAEYEKFGVKKDNEFVQLNANLLQIENEYYSTVRPKQICDVMEMPINALKNRGVAYIELRSLDIDVFEPNGINEATIFFVEALLLYCLLEESPNITKQEHKIISKNILDVAHNGRMPNLKLQKGNDLISLTDWSKQIFDDLLSICNVLDECQNTNKYKLAYQYFYEMIDEPERTPSARILTEMRNNNEGFYQFSLRKSQEHEAYFKKVSLSYEERAVFEKQVNDSLEQQNLCSQNSNESFDDFLEKYFAQARLSDE